MNRLLAATLCALPVIASASRLLDNESKAPVAGAWIIAERIECGGFGSCSCREVRVSRSDAKGDFTASRGRNLYAYAPGYWTTHTADNEMGLSRRTVDRRFDHLDPVTARLRYLDQTAREMSCFSAPTAQRAALLPVYRDMFAEARSLSTLPEHRSLARRICHEMYSLTVSGSGHSPSPAVAEALESSYLGTAAPECVEQPQDDTDRARVLRAIERGDRMELEKALAAGFDPNRPLNDLGEPAIAVATRLRRPELVLLLARSGARVDQIDAGNRVALDLAMSGPPGDARKRQLPVVQALLEGGANPNRPDVFGKPPLIRAAEAEDTEAFLLLLRHGADINVRQSCQRADPNCTGKGNTVLHVARDPKLAAAAIQHGADVNARNDGVGDTPLAHVFFPEIARMLLAKGADPNATNTAGWTPLMYAVQTYESYKGSQWQDRYREIVELLVESGARLDARNQHGVDALYYAKDPALKVRMRELAAKRR
jgi:ankyrin repeat protein